MSGVATASVVIGAYSAKKSADAQEKAANRAAQSELEQNRAAKTLSAGNIGANNRLSFLMGTSAGVVPSLSKTIERLRKANPTMSEGTAKIRAQGIIKLRKAAISARSKSPLYGSLMKNFEEKDFYKDPGYQWRLNQGISNLDKSAAARGGLLSGAHLKDLNRYNQDYASNEYGAASDRFNQNRQNTYNMLSGQASGAQNLMNFTAGANSRANEYMTQGANASAAGRMGVANALTGGLSTGIGAYQQQQLINKIPNSSFGGSRNINV